MNAINTTYIYYHKCIALFSEIIIEHSDLLGIWYIGGKFNFLAFTIDFDANIWDWDEFVLL